MHLLGELISPLLTPIVLLFYLRPRSIDIVDFFRNFTVSVDGVGDVCSFAQMDVRKHGNPDWQVTASKEEKMPRPNACHTNQYTQGEHGKTELSLVHFTMTNPHWKMPTEAREFVHGLRKHALSDLNRARTGGTGGLPTTTTAMGQSLISVGNMGVEYSSIIQSILQNHNITNIYTPNIINAGSHNPQMTMPIQQSQMYSPHSMDFDRMLQQNLIDTSGVHLRSSLDDISEDIDDNLERGDRAPHGLSQSIADVPPLLIGGARVEPISMSIRGRISRHEGPIESSQQGLLSSLAGDHQPINVNNLDLTPAEMSLSTLFLHELHHRQVSNNLNLYY